MRRIVVTGGSGFFGGAIVERLRADGFLPLVASRRTTSDIVVDVEDRDSLRRGLRAGDVVVDAAGPFQRRTMCLVKAAIDVRFDLIDIADSLAYVRAVYALRQRIDTSGISVYTACSSVSAIAAAMIRHSGIDSPLRVTGFLAPATKHTAVAGTAASLLGSVGRPVEVLEEGNLITRAGWRQTATFPMPGRLGNITGHLFESADAITLPAVWPSLQTVNLFVDTNVRGLNTLFRAAANYAVLRRLIERCQPLGLRMSRWLGSAAGGLGYEVEEPGGRIVRLAWTSDHQGYLTSVAPAAIVAQKLAQGDRVDTGLVAADRYVEPDELIAYLNRVGIKLTVF